LTRDSPLVKVFQKAIGARDDGDFGSDSFSAFYKYICENLLINVGGKAINLEKKETKEPISPTPPISSRIHYAWGNFNNLVFSEEFKLGQTTRSKIQDQLEKRRERGDFIDKDDLIVIFREDGSVVQVGFKKRAGTSIPPVVLILFGLFIASIGLFFMIAVAPRFIKLITAKENDGEYIGPQTIDHPRLNRIALQDLKNFFQYEFREIRSRLAQPTSDTRIIKHIDAISSLLEGSISKINTQQEKLVKVLSEYFETDKRQRNQQASDLSLLKANSQEMLSRIPKPKEVDALQKQKQDIILLFIRHLTQWVRNLRENHENLFRNTDFSIYLVSFWRDFNSNNLLNLLSYLEKAKEGLIIDDQFNLDLEFKTVLFTCLSPAMVLMNHFETYEERTRKNIERAMYHILKNLTDLLNEAITTLKRPPIGIVPVEIKTFSKFYDPNQIMHTIRGDREILIPSPEKRQEIDKYSDYILAVEGWAFERNGELLDGRKARVVIG
jgi:hypothetical protein